MQTWKCLCLWQCFVDAVSATVKGSGVLVFTALAVLDVDGIDARFS